MAIRLACTSPCPEHTYAHVRPAVLAHRGDWLEGDDAGPQNSVRAVLGGLDGGADGAEIDARMSADGIVMLHHDPVAEAPGGHGLAVDAICTLTRAQLGHLDTLEDLLVALEKWSLGHSKPVVLNIELKDLPGEPGWGPRHRLAREVAQLLLARPPGRWPGAPAVPGLQVVVSCFDLVILSQFHHEAPSVATGLLLAAGADWRKALSGVDWLRTVHPAGELSTPELFAAASQRSLGVVPWTVDEPAQAARLGLMGATGIITNRPRAVLAALASG